MSFADAMRKDGSFTRTENGAVALNTTGGERPWIQEYPRCKQFCIRTQKSFQLLIKISD